ncbi:HlyD family efflux transporter periplasmic adaptor subunit [Moorella naiadis]|uniref:HlyD family secretion protein n=1 Tax=Moorella naiadis (nom. illeg.) TaxID=3093670 RepID=UPI003D9C9702
MSKGKKTCFLLLILLVNMTALVSGCQRRDKEQYLTASGTIEATEVKVMAEVGGTLQDVAIKEGDMVATGQILACLDQSGYQIPVAQAEAGVEAAQAALAEARAGARSQEITAAEQEAARLEAGVRTAAEQVATLQEQVNLLADNLQRAQKLFQAGALPEQELRNRESQYNQARHQLEGTQAQLEGAKAQLEGARARLDLLRAGSTGYTLDRLAAGVKQNQSSLEQAQLNLGKTILKAPAAGLVSSVNYAKGELVRPGAEVATLLDTANLWLNVYIPENRLGEVKVGQAVQIQADPYPGQSFPGQVEYIAPQAEFTPRNVQTREERVNLVFRVKIRVTGGQDQLRPGLPVDVTFLPAEHGQ